MSPGNGKYCTRDDAKLFSYLASSIIPFENFIIPFETTSPTIHDLSFDLLVSFIKHLNTLEGIRDSKSRSIATEKSAWLWQISGHRVSAFDEEVSLLDVA